MKNILLISSGLSPQVITETLFYYHNSDNSILIDEIHVITDSTGARLIDNKLFNGPGWYYKYLDDYKIDKKTIKFDKKNIYVLKDNNGKPLKDLLSVNANDAAINQILLIVKNLTDDLNNRIIANVAGGRKTMSVFLGQAMQFYGKEHDILTHVIIDEEYLRLSDFYYPPPTRLIKKVDNKTVDYSKIKIHLSELPYIRLKPALGTVLNHAKEKDLSQLISIAQKYIYDLAKPVKIELDTNYTLNINDETIKLPKKDLAIYSALLDLNKNNYKEKGKDLGFISIANILEIDFLKTYLNYYKSYYNTRNIYVDKETNRIANEKERIGFYTEQWIQQTRSKINRKLKENLSPYLYAMCQIISSGKYSDTSYGIPLNKTDNINI